MKHAMLALALVGFSFSSVSYAADTECKRVVASAHPAYPPYQWQSNGEIVGASVDLHRKIFAELGVDFVASYQGPWKRVLSAAEQGQIDLVMALKQTPAREAFLEYTTSPVFANPFAVFVASRSPFQFQSWNDLIGKIGGKNAGDRYGQPFDTFVENNLYLESARTPALNFKKLAAERIDYFIHSRYAGAAFLQTSADKDAVMALEKNINDGYIHSGFSKQSVCKALIPYVSKRYQELLDDGTAERLLDVNLERWRQHAAAKGL